ncbi:MULTISPECIES: bifunctional phosphoribosyl-AMP cyclohydrolase/phosphoribosyl-ATP diphosphatase HisIE [unclassified Planococcus (in: firmicutes)]|uniref:bifunctional phosphoribosyl-AMP cyclohydrolase/phosphoribosyl-ATP diphosphatase HisIE n=1 Tax=unclassified Planococcus (in: firmicutes) TaxID=2662419 RepID=UPI000C7E536E|nr:MULTISPECIES: bifunctional phosphoribosyl-AMP cyclohydrolase/phosphoribosyl-ATP diphosphatase HisIE [unclassified Planococcus (in: firmicutes)]PKG46123.1 bifunctional phosphoribosyl-AMP cyclohydrolase/phosphoribosyl-ATP pyrophosphatase [Planococcus sp. Urea-trap-24]PKG89888.1 bifunctional phosphoribosyl-AMP cyclohydrolase/phosphoribosyl-ATP pyrophosphatase [Planococcus sp. Urea-3u-39]PKH43974.1 bifunctional phosphoribosyl-AMP cyclohydrolase/phosphoribosyl-ATP pyrophosphatase [Planococcus sp. 
MTNVKYDENGLVPIILQDATTKQVLTLAYANEEAVKRTIDTKETWLYSRSRKELWNKGATSGNTQRVQSVQIDCDGDSLIYEVIPNGPACHTGETSCFHETLAGERTASASDMITELSALIKQRESDLPEGAYTTYLFEEGVDKICKKVGEEAAEVIIAAKNRDARELATESADLLYHLLVLLQEQKVDFKEVTGVLEERHAAKKDK